MRRLERTPTSILLPLFLVATACGGTSDGDDGMPPETLEVVGAWSSPYGGETISATKWGTAMVVEFSNTLNFAITQNPADDAFNPNKFAKIVWTEPGDGAFFYCTVEFGKDTAAEAKASTKTADDSDPATSGCGGFPWTELYHPIEVEGRYHSAFGGIEEIDHRKFSFTSVIEFDNDANYAITQNPPEDMFNPNKFGKVVWTTPVNGRFFYCFVTFDEETAEAAKNTTNVADDSNPSVDGCGGFPWTELEPPLEIEGEYVSNFGSDESVSSDMWGTTTVRGYDNDTNVAYLQLPEDDEFNPNKFNKVVWTEPAEDGAFYYCWVDFGLDTLEDAKASTATWDDSDPDNAGCGGFAWTKLTVK